MLTEIRVLNPKSEIWQLYQGTHCGDGDANFNIFAGGFWTFLWLRHNNRPIFLQRMDFTANEAIQTRYVCIYPLWNGILLGDLSRHAKQDASDESKASLDEVSPMETWDTKQ